MSTREKNKGTQIWIPGAPQASVTGEADVFARAAAFLPRSPRFGAAHGYRIFWLERGELRFRDVVADPRGFAIVGRHSRAHVQFAHDETIALRHLVLRAERSEAGALSLRIADLLAPLPLYVDGSDEPLHACVIEGAFSARLGAYAFCGLPFDGCAPLGAEGGPGRGDQRRNHDAEDADDADDLVEGGQASDERPGLGTIEGAPYGRARQTAEGDAAPAGDGAERPEPPLPPPAWSAPHLPLPAKPKSIITTRPRTTLIEVMPSSHPDDALVTLELSGPRGSATVHLGEEHLDGLVVLGRYDRCRAGGQVYSEGASRMHVALTVVGDGITVIDLASTNGVYRRGRKMHYAHITETETLMLGCSDENRVRVKIHAALRPEGR